MAASQRQPRWPLRAAQPCELTAAAHSQHRSPTQLRAAPPGPAPAGTPPPCACVWCNPPDAATDNCETRVGARPHDRRKSREIKYNAK